LSVHSCSLLAILVRCRIIRGEGARRVIRPLAVVLVLALRVVHKLSRVALPTLNNFNLAELLHVLLLNVGLCVLVRLDPNVFGGRGVRQLVVSVGRAQFASLLEIGSIWVERLPLVVELLLVGSHLLLIHEKSEELILLLLLQLAHVLLLLLAEWLLWVR
jgi:hypothetical protein